MQPHDLEGIRDQRRRLPEGGGAHSRTSEPARTKPKGGNGFHDVGFALYRLHPSGTEETRPKVTQNSPSKTSDSWTFFSNHGHVLFCLHRDPDIRLKVVATQVGITERAVQKIVAELEEAKIVKRKRVGRRNHYEIRKRSKLRHPIESHRTVADLLDFVH